MRLTRNRPKINDMKRPIIVGLLIGLTLITGCAKKQAVAMLPEAASEGTAPDLTWSLKPNAETVAATTSLPLDEDAKKLGKKVFARNITSVRRSPRNGAPEYYRVAAGSPLFVTPTTDKRWLEVRMSEGRKGYVRTDQTTAAEALAEAQRRLSDKERLTPGPKKDSEPDDGKANEPNTRDPEVAQAIVDLEEALTGAENGLDRVRAEAAGFQGSTENWPIVKAAVVEELTAFQNEFQSVALAIQTLTSLSGKLTANQRSAFQSTVGAQGEVTDAAQSIRQTLNQMVEGNDWTSLIGTVDQQVSSLSSAMDALRSGINRL